MALPSTPGRILLRNVYGWFERGASGRHRLAALGKAALQRWGDVAGLRARRTSDICKWQNR